MHAYFFSFLIFSLIGTAQASAQFLDQGTLPSVQASSEYFAGGAGTRGAIYIVPNEINPEAANAILDKSFGGVYLSVGGERGLIGAALAPQTTHLLQVDTVPEVVLYNQLNVVLLKVAHDLADFIALRQAPLAEWRKRMHSNLLNDKERKWLMSAEANQFYRNVESAARERLTNPQFFKGVSYLNSPEVFEKVRSLASGGKIQVLQGNLTDLKFLKSVALQLRRRGLYFSVLDISNAWEAKYIGPAGVDQVIGSLSEALLPKTIFMASSVARCLEAHLCYWDFSGFSIGLMNKAKGHWKTVNSMSHLVQLKTSLKPNRLYTEKNFNNWSFLLLPVKASCQKWLASE